MGVRDIGVSVGVIVDDVDVQYPLRDDATDLDL